MLDRMFRILICSDLRDSANRALSQALRLAQRLQAELHLCHITRWAPLKPGPGRFRPRSQPLSSAQAEANLRTLVLRLGLPAAAELSIHIHIRIGRPVDRILELIEEIRPDLVAICAHPQVPYRRKMLGTVARQLAVRSPIPLLIVPSTVQ